MTVFEAFPNGLEAWKISKVNYSTMTGNMEVGTPATINVIADEINSTEIRTGASASPLDSDTLLYVQPAELPTTDIAKLIANYGIQDPAGRTYKIMDAAKGKNQETGELEHIELIVRQDGTVQESE